MHLNHLKPACSFNEGSSSVQCLSPCSYSIWCHYNLFTKSSSLQQSKTLCKQISHTHYLLMWVKLGALFWVIKIITVYGFHFFIQQITKMTGRMTCLVPYYFLWSDNHDGRQHLYQYICSDIFTNDKLHNIHMLILTDFMKMCCFISSPNYNNLPLINPIYCGICCPWLQW